MSQRVNHLNTNLPQFLQKHSFACLFVVFLAWIVYGAFPLVSYESDGIHISAGAEAVASNGFILPPVIAHEYSMQPLVTVTLVVVRHLFPMLSCEQIYCLLTLLCAVLFIAGSIRLVQKLTPFGGLTILLAVVLLPESYAIAMYPNSAVLAAALYVWALVFLAEGKVWLPLALMCVAPLYRLDVLLVYPAILPLMVYRGRSPWRALALSAAFAIAVVAVIAIGSLCTQANPLDVFASFGKWSGGRIKPLKVLMAIFGFYSIFYVVLLPLGLLTLARSRNYMLLLLIVTPLALNHFFYSGMGSASKHYLYILPFAVLAGTYALSYIFTEVRSKWVRVSLAIASAAVLLCSVTMELGSTPWLHADGSNPQSDSRLPLASIPIGSNRLTLGLGAGQAFTTADEICLVTGNLFYPYYIRQVKNRWVAARSIAHDLLAKEHRCTVLTFPFADDWVYALDLVQDGYRFAGRPMVYTLKHEDSGREVLFVNRELYSGGTLPELTEYVDEQIQDMAKGGDKVYVISSVEKYMYILDALAKETTLVTRLTPHTFVVNN